MNKIFIIVPIIILVVGVIILLIILTNKWQPKIKNALELKGIIEKAMTDYDQPALAVSFVHGENLWQALGGDLVWKSDQKISKDSLFHIGSVTKSMTGLLLARMISQGKLHYGDTLGELLTNYPMKDLYKKVTLEDLLLSRGGIIPFQRTIHEDPEIVKKLWFEIPREYPNPIVQRQKITELALSLEPVTEPGEKSVYSNVGWAILGHIIEIHNESSYEKLLRQDIFEPLGVFESQIGGWPASSEQPQQPRGHYHDENSEPVPQELDDSYCFPDWMNPAGGVSLKIGDFTRYALEHFYGLKGRGLLLNKRQYEEIHRIHLEVPVSEMYQESEQDGNMTLGYGWAVIPVDGGNWLSFADGSGGTFFARILLYPKLDVAFIGLANSGSGHKAFDYIIEAVSGFKWNS